LHLRQARHVRRLEAAGAVSKRATIAAGMVLGLFAVPAHAQSPSLPPDGQSLNIERSADIPPPLLAAMRKAECRQDDALLLAFPIELFRPSPASSPMAI